MAAAPRSIVAIDVGATNVDVVQFSPGLDVIDQCATPVVHDKSGPYLSLDAESVLDFAVKAIKQFDSDTPVDAIVPCTHGSAAALLDAKGDLAFPIMCYQAEVPGDVAEAYDAIEPSFDEVFAPTNPAALTLARQFLWQEMLAPERFANVHSILPYAQYIAYRLCGVMACEITSLGAQTHLWAPRVGDFSHLAKARGWSDRFAPRHAAGDVLGRLRLDGLRGDGQILCGIHDSSASFLQFAELEPVVLLSTGTWIIAFDTDADLTKLDPARDQVANVRTDGAPIASARFMGGKEYGLIAGPGNHAEPSLEIVQELIAADTMALPSFTDSGGPMPGTGGLGTIVGPPPQTDAARASLAALYTAMMTAFALDKLGRTRRIVVDGVFAKNTVYIDLLSALLPDRDIHTVSGQAGSARGAASLALPDAAPRLELATRARPVINGLNAYYAHWRHAADQNRKTQ